MPRDKAANEARHIARVVRRRADRAEDERGYQVPEGTGESEDNSDSSAEEAAQDAGDLPRRLAPASAVPVPARAIALPVGWMRRRQLQVSQAVILAAQRHHDLGLLPGTMRLIEQAMLLRRFPIGARLRELVAIIAALLPDAWRRLRGRVPAQDIPEQAVQQQASATQIELAQASPDKASALMSLAQLTVHHMKLEGKLHKLTGDGELDDQDLEFEWQHRLKTTPNWQKSTDHMPDHQKQHFFSTERRFFVEGIHNAFARAQAKLEAQAKLDAEASLEAEAKPEPDQLGELAEALAKFQHDRLQELDGFSPELTQDLTQEPPRLPKTFVQQALTPKEYEALALAMFQHNRLHRDSPNAVEAISYQVLSKEKYEALALAMVGKELDYQQMRNQLRHKEQRRRQNEKKRSKRKELKARGKNFDAEQSEKARRALEEEWRCEAREIEEQARAKRLSQEEQRRKECEEREVEKQAKADRLLQEELAQQRTKAKKQRKQRALKKKNAALDDASASSVWQAVKSFRNYMFSLAHPPEVKPTGARDD